MPIVIISDDDSDVDLPVIIEDSASDEDQLASIKREMMQFTISPRNSSDTPSQPLSGNPSQPLSGNPSQPLNDPEAKLEIPGEKMPTDGEVLPAVDQPKKRKCKTKHLCVPPGKLVNPSTPIPFSFCRNLNCNIPGCFLRDIEKLKEYTGRNFKRNKDELVRRLYVLFNETVFDKKLPEKLEICWNKKMLRTAGLCSSTHSSKTAKRQTKIDISLKVCDSADRIRDTLAHELCHAASWLLNGIRTSHGYTWKYYARKCNLAHPELPLVTRFHNYKINYKIYYECTRCKARIGRYSRSLDTERSVCTSCKGRLVLLPLYRKDGTPIKPHVRPFAKYVKQHYRIVRKRMRNATHGDVMRKLSKGYFICKKNNTL
ncbi:acidic repeat-containing protein [Phyllostomus discolor]|uniref:Acidic repeat-containing protein n=1 Tax=Phyllostomus discolor TaxID=89673 RepID=A0A7E6CYY6_9CHIR|nr:acidic repeat-containing protein [Phyllostomus discolor]